MNESPTRNEPDSPPDKNLRVCFVALHALTVIEPEFQGPVGGSETRAWTFARGLAQDDRFHVSFALHDARRPSHSQRDGVTLCVRHEPLKNIRYNVAAKVNVTRSFPYLQVKEFSPELIWQIPLLALVRPFKSHRSLTDQLTRFFQQIEADVYCTFGVNETSFRVIQAAHSKQARVILFTVLDGDLDERYASDSTFVNPRGDRGPVCHAALMSADHIVVQTERQQTLMQARFGRESTLIENPIDVDDWDHAHEPSAMVLTKLPDRFVLWIGRAEAGGKRPDRCLDLARGTPDVSYLMVLNPRDPIIENTIRSSAPRNVTIVSQIPYAAMPTVLKRATALVSTSEVEGFPNVFLQAAISRVPIVSLEAAPEFIRFLGVGMHAQGNFQTLMTSIESIWHTAPSPELLEAARRRVIDRYSARHAVDALGRLIVRIAEDDGRQIP